jgi:hypothetical protein
MAEIKKIREWADKWRLSYADAYALLAVIGADHLSASSRGGRTAAINLGPEGRRARASKAGKVGVRALRQYWADRHRPVPPPQLPAHLRELQRKVLDGAQKLQDAGASKKR